MKVDKESEKIKKYLKEKSVLLVTDSPTDRTAWKKTFVDLGVALNNFHNAQTISDVKVLIETRDIDILFTADKLGGRATLELMQAHIDKYPDRTNYFCYFVSEKNSLALAALVAEMQVNGLIVKPYNQQDLNNIIKESMVKRLCMSEELKKFYQIMGEIRSKNLDIALESSEIFISKSPNSPNGYFLKGLSKKYLGKVEDALESWKQGLNRDGRHYHTLCSLFDTYAEMKDYIRGYEVSKELTSGYPINPNRIPDLIRSALATKNYHGLIKFCEMIINLDEDLEGIKKPIAAALVLSGKCLLFESKAGNCTLIEEASKKAISLTPPQSNIYIVSLENLLELEKYEDVKGHIDLIPTDEMTTDLLSLELLLLERVTESSEVFVKAQNMIKNQQKTPTVYKVLLRSAKALNKTPEQLEDIVDDGAKHFPYIKAELESILR